MNVHPFAGTPQYADQRKVIGPTVRVRRVAQHLFLAQVTLGLALGDDDIYVVGEAPCEVVLDGTPADLTAQQRRERDYGCSAIDYGQVVDPFWSAPWGEWRTFGFKTGKQMRAAAQRALRDPDPQKRTRVPTNPVCSREDVLRVWADGRQHCATCLTCGGRSPRTQSLATALAWAAEHEHPASTPWLVSLEPEEATDASGVPIPATRDTYFVGTVDEHDHHELAEAA